MQKFRCFDPLYGRTSFTELQTQLMRSPEVQRLRSIRMCNINSLLITGASQISRFEHSLGVVRLAQEWAIASKATDEEAEVVCAAALLHDIKTGPFGHSLEYALTDNPDISSLNHERIDHEFYEDYFQRTGANVSYFGARFAASEMTGRLWLSIAETIAGNGPLGPLISNSIDLDNIDNVIRLAYHVGLATREDGQIGISLARDLKIVSGNLSISSDSFFAIERWQYLRSHLYRFLLHDWAEFSAKGMLTKAIELATEAEIIGTDSWILTDDELVRNLIASSVGEVQEVGELIKRIMLGNLYNPVSMLKSNSTTSYEVLSNPKIKREIEIKMSSILKCKCLIHTILDKAKTHRKLSLYVRDEGRFIDFGDDSQEILVGLFASREFSEGALLRASDRFRREMHQYLHDFEVLQDPLEDPFKSSTAQLRLI